MVTVCGDEVENVTLVEVGAVAQSDSKALQLRLEKCVLKTVCSFELVGKVVVAEAE